VKLVRRVRRKQHPTGYNPTGGCTARRKGASHWDRETTGCRRLPRPRVVINDGSQGCPLPIFPEMQDQTTACGARRGSFEGRDGERSSQSSTRVSTTCHSCCCSTQTANDKRRISQRQAANLKLTQSRVRVSNGAIVCPRGNVQVPSFCDSVFYPDEEAQLRILSVFSMPKLRPQPALPSLPLLCPTRNNKKAVACYF